MAKNTLLDIYVKFNINHEIVNLNSTCWVQLINKPIFYFILVDHFRSKLQIV
jgi:hypothetical protein